MKDVVLHRFYGKNLKYLLDLFFLLLVFFAIKNSLLLMGLTFCWLISNIILDGRVCLTKTSLWIFPYLSKAQSFAIEDIKSISVSGNILQSLFAAKTICFHFRHGLKPKKLVVTSRDVIDFQEAVAYLQNRKEDELRLYYNYLPSFFKWLCLGLFPIVFFRAILFADHYSRFLDMYLPIGYLVFVCFCLSLRYQNAKMFINKEFMTEKKRTDIERKAFLKDVRSVSLTQNRFQKMAHSKRVTIELGNPKRFVKRVMSEDSAVALKDFLDKYRNEKNRDESLRGTANIGKIIEPRLS